MIEKARLPEGGTGLADAYRAGDPRLSPFFRVHPVRPEALLAPPPAGARAAPEAVARAAGAYLEGLGAPPEARRAARRLADPACAVVATGQQAGLLGGPLLVAWKAAGAIRLARWIEERTGRPSVPVFWVASEDHDTAEIREVRWTTRAGALRRAALPLEPGRRPIEAIPIDDALRGPIDRAIEALSGEGDTPAFREAAGAYRSAPDLGAAGAALLAVTFGRRGLVVVEPRALRGLGGPVFARELEDPGRPARLVAGAGDALRALGLRPRLRGSRPVALFVLRGGERVDVLLEDAAGRDGVPLQEARTLAARNPARLSPGVALRPVLQDHLLGTWAMVAGPAEIAYMAQLRGVYEHLGVTMPAVVPRPSGAWLGPRLARSLQRCGLDPARVAAGDRPQDQLRGVPGEAAVEGLAEAAARAFRELEATIPARDPLARRLRQSRHRIEREIARLRDRLRARALREDAERAALLERAGAALRPEGAPQERWASWIAFLARHGASWIDAIIEAADPFEPGPWLLLWQESPAPAGRGAGGADA